MDPATEYDEPPHYAVLRPTWRLLWNRLRVFHGRSANRRAERLILRAMTRGWSAARLERLLQLLIARDHSRREERHRAPHPPR